MRTRCPKCGRKHCTCWMPWRKDSGTIDIDTVIDWAIVLVLVFIASIIVYGAFSIPWSAGS